MKEDKIIETSFTPEQEVTKRIDNIRKFAELQNKELTGLYGAATRMKSYRKGRQESIEFFLINETGPGSKGIQRMETPDHKTLGWAVTEQKGKTRRYGWLHWITTKEEAIKIHKERKAN